MQAAMAWRALSRALASGPAQTRPRSGRSAVPPWLYAQRPDRSPPSGRAARLRIPHVLQGRLDMPGNAGQDDRGAILLERQRDGHMAGHGFRHRRDQSRSRRRLCRHPAKPLTVVCVGVRVAETSGLHKHTCTPETDTPPPFTRGRRKIAGREGAATRGLRIGDLYSGQRVSR
jgi:hypothetical protein